MLIFTVTACSSNSNNIKKEQTYTLEYEFTSSKNYQEIYSIIMNGVNKCTRSVGTSKTVAEGELLNTSSTANIVILLKSFFGKYPHINIRIEKAGENTIVKVKNDFRTWDDFTKSIKYWITDDLPPC